MRNESRWVETRLSFIQPASCRGAPASTQLSSLVNPTVVVEVSDSCVKGLALGVALLREEERRRSLWEACRSQGIPKGVVRLSISSLSSCYHKIPDKSISKEKEFILSQAVHHGWEGRAARAVGGW